MEVRENSVDKGKASKMVIAKLLGEKLPTDTVIVAAGDADNDEGMFEAFAGDSNAVTIRVWEGSSQAQWRVDGPYQIRQLLHLVGSHFQKAGKILK